MERAGEWKVAASLLPGQKGTLRWFDEYGDRLLRVRYRYRGEFRVTTVEIVVDRAKVR